MSQINVMHMVGLTQGYGVERQLLDQLEVSKANKEIKHYVCALKISDAIKSELEALEIPFIVNNLHYPWQIIQFINYSKENNINILHVHNLLRFPFRSRIVPRMAGIPYIIEHEHGMIWNMRYTQLIKWTNNLANLNICNSHAAKILLQKKCGIDATVIHNGVKVPQDSNNKIQYLYDELNLSNDDAIVGFVGRLNTPKGVHAFIKTISIVKNKCPQAKFIIAGDGPMRQELEAFAENLGVSQHIKFLGFRKDVRDIMSLFKVLVVPSIREPFGNVVIEAAFARKVVVASNVDGISETVVNGETGYLIECNEPALARATREASRLPEIVVDGLTGNLRAPMLPNIDQMAEKIVTCLKRPELAYQMGESAYERARKYFSIDRYVHDLNEIYRRKL